MRWLLSLIGSLVAGLVAVNTTEVQPAVVVISLFCSGLGYAFPKSWWGHGLIVGVGVFLGYWVARLVHYSVAAPPDPSIAGALVALIPALVFAALGAGARSLVDITKSPAGSGPHG